jgi:uncharacterized protein YhfF
MFNRGLDKFGLPPFLAYILLPICFVGLSNYLFSKSEFAEYIYVLLAFGLLTKLTDKKRNEGLYRRNSNRKTKYKLKHMRHVLFISLLIFSSCKTVTTENEVDASVVEMWEGFTNSNSTFKGADIPESFYFHNNKEDANRLADLVLKGKKKSSSSLYFLYEEYNADLPKIGAKQIVTDFEGKAQAVIETTKVDTIPFNKISVAYAEMDMGTQVEPLKKWKKAHWDFFTTVMNEFEEKPTEEMLVVCESFKIIWTTESE